MVVRIGWIVDTQRDFMEPNGRLYVRDLHDDGDAGASQIEDKLVEAVGWMRSQAALIIYTGDWHAYDDAEIDSHRPDPGRGTYPPHCMGRSSDPDERRGAEIIPSIAPRDPLVLDIGATPSDAAIVVERALEQGRPIFIRKNRFDVFEGNAATEALVKTLEQALGSVEFYVVGVARDVCVTQAVDGLSDRGYAVVAIRDATWGLGLEPEDETLHRWRGRGRVIETDELPVGAGAAHA